MTAREGVSLAREVAPLLADPLWVSVGGDDETGSTNEDARALAQSGTPEGTAVVARRQSAGRGRMGRTWESPEGGAYVSVVLRPPASSALTGSLALVVALGIATGLEPFGLTPRLKWPNDVWLDGRKVAGVLLEMTTKADRVEWVVAGFGLNVVRTADSPAAAAYVSDTRDDLGVAEVTASVLDGVAAAYQRWLAEGFDRMAGQFDRLSVLAGQSVVVSDGAGVAREKGTVVGVDREGRLLLQGDAGVVPVASGEVTLRR